MGGQAGKRAIAHLRDWLFGQDIGKNSWRTGSALAGKSLSRRSFPWSENMLKDIVAVEALGGHRLYIRFEDGVDGEIDIRDLVEFTGVFAPLQDPAEVARVRVEPDTGTACWPNGADLDPDVLYAALSGKPVELPESADFLRSA
jgi:hypothetical protein